MHTQTLTFVRPVVDRGIIRPARRPGFAVLALAVFVGFAAHGATVISKAPNVSVHIGLPFNDLEFQNPLAGTERVLSHAVLDWRDADCPPNLDWTVSDPLKAGYSLSCLELYLLQAGVSATTATLAPSQIVSIHLNGDNNDGIASVQVDGVEVARLDMYFAGAGGQCCESALVLVTGLPNTTHTITVNDLGAGAGGQMADDVHLMGAAALKDSPVKWYQPPAAAHPTNLFYGWNQPSEITQPGMLIAADDWVCSSSLPVTRIRWWGSYLGWTSNIPPVVTPNAFLLTVYSDVGAGTNAPFSQPGNIVWQTLCTNFTSKFEGWDCDPRTTNLEACFLFEQKLTPAEYFTQPGGPGTIYWLSIAANFPQGPVPAPAWGWKTRPRDPTSPAPDAAVFSPNQPPWGWSPLFWYYPTNLWDLAFELFSDEMESGVKWEQVPDLSTNGMDVNDTWVTNPQVPPQPPFLLADDFVCTNPGYLTNIMVWGSWSNDLDLPMNLMFTVSILDDVPVSHTNAFSHPGNLLWQAVFTGGRFTYSLYANNINEWWLTPPNQAVFPGDHACYLVNFNLSTNEWFWQTGTAQSPKVYWLSVQAQLPQGMPFNLWGWKTCPTNWNDGAVWASATSPVGAPWAPLFYPPTHPRSGKPADLAFRLDGCRTLTEVKWSQPPALYTEPDVYYGWNETSLYGYESYYPIVADDWVCTSTNPVTDIHWWGSFSNWCWPTPPQLPDAFCIAFWTDLPANTNEPGSFSHPLVCEKVLQATNYTVHFAGWDVDPRNPAAIPEACFEFDLDLSTNQWFVQNPTGGTNIYWVSIAAVYNQPGTETPFWGWKTRPRDPDSLAPDDAVRIFYPTEPLPGMPYVAGTNIWWPEPTNSWDMAFVLTTRAPEAQDFGDAPSSYPTLLSNNAARHFLLPGFYLGACVDPEPDGLPNVTATGDDTNNLLDEDGVVFTSPLLCGTQAWANVVLTSPWGTGQLDAWVDFNRNGGWEPAEQVCNSQTLLSGTNTLSFAVPTNATVGPSYARFRLSRVGGLFPAGAAADGEVEDHSVTLVQRRPTLSITITNILTAVSNVTLRWTAETNVHYWVQAASSLSNAPSLTWTRVGPEVIGPANSQTESNALSSARFYRVLAPYVWP